MFSVWWSRNAMVLFIVVCLVFNSVYLHAAKERHHEYNVYTATWVVDITQGDKTMADIIAKKYGFFNLGEIAGLNNIYQFELSGRDKLNARIDSPYTSKSAALLSEPSIEFVEQQVIKRRDRKSFMVPTDPLYPTQWNLLNSGQYGQELVGNDLNVEKAWLQGLTGCNVTVAVVDDGLQFSHGDLYKNYAPQISYNFVEGHPDPSTSFPWHGTSCGGIIASSKNNLCGVGVAHEANLGGLALLGANSDINEANSLSYEKDIIDIYSNSWGPPDTGYHVDGPGYLTKRVFERGVREGRDGKGSIYVWANGNGGSYDDCAADGYSGSIYTISVGAIGVDGNPSPFDEECSAKMVTAYVTDVFGDSTVTTTDIDGGCTTSFGGTSAAAPMVSGIVALALEANPSLTWRDVQYLIVYTSNPRLTNTANSITNGAGLLVSRQFGFGVVDAEAMVTRARHWINAPPHQEETVSTISSGRATGTAPFHVTVDHSGLIQYLEHVIVNMSVNNTFGGRGDMKIELTSPSQTVSVLLGYRDGDFSSGGYLKWPFMSVMFWGENPTGQWVLTVSTQSIFTDVSVSDVAFQFYGSSIVPEAVENIPEECHPMCRRGCAQAGSAYCDACVNLRNAYTYECIGTCPQGYVERNGYCYNPNISSDECNSLLKDKNGGSCVDAGFSGCCIYGSCIAENVEEYLSFFCYCDALCYVFGDCCDDIELTGCRQSNTTEGGGARTIPYITFGVTEGVASQSVPSFDDGLSSPIDVIFPFGSHLQQTVYVGTNGYFTFKEFTNFSPFTFNGNRNLSLVAPFFTDIDISSGYGQINYEIHTKITSQFILSQVNSVINDHAQTEFSGDWLLVAMWDEVPRFGGGYSITSTFQAIIATDFSRSFSVFVYYCGHLNHSNDAAIGFTTSDGHYANHPASLRGFSQSIACLNSPANPWVNVVYEITQSENECAIGNGGCYQICVDTFLSYECSCEAGYTLASDGYSCNDINECEIELDINCEQNCINSIGSYICECRDDYSLNDDGKTCSPSCGRNLTERNGSFHTPDWPHSYPSLDFRCEWLIDIENMTGGVIEITFNEPYGIRGRDPCSTDYVEVLDGIELDSVSLGKHCFLRAPHPIVTSTPQTTIVFQGSSNPHLPRRVGVSMSYHAGFIVNECNVNNGGCAQVCINTITSYICSCDTGYTLDNDGHGCVDVNECSIAEHQCDSICENKNGSYVCSCRPDYELNNDGRTCFPTCNGNFTEPAGFFHTPDWPHSYPSLDFSCEWVIDIENMTGAVIEITFDETYGIGGRDPCPTDYVEVLNGIEHNTTSLGKHCFLIAPHPIVTSSTQATVVFQASSNPHSSRRVGVSVSYLAMYLVNECEVNNGGCAQFCVDTTTSYICSCDIGYALGNDSYGCVDINECFTTEHECEQICQNTHGSYTCNCNQGYSLSDDSQTCSISCGGNLTENTGSFHTPDWPHSYPSLDFRCEWMIDIDSVTDAIIEITFNGPYGVRGKYPCQTDYVEVLDGIELNSTSLGKHCHITVPDIILTSSTKATVVFQASSHRHATNRVGVSASYVIKYIVNECDMNNGGCAQKCVDLMYSFSCYCNEGFKLDEDGLNCIDVDECSIGDNGCEQTCINNYGSYSCECTDGYFLDINGITCSISCGEMLSNTSGSFQTPGWPGGYPQEDFICEWTINVSIPSIIRFEVDSSVYGINGQPPCPEDHIEFFQSVGGTSLSLGRFCKCNVPEPITVSTGAAQVVFEGTYNLTRPANIKGVRVFYEVFR